jgi:serine/threonine protein phosphatase 1
LDGLRPSASDVPASFDAAVAPEEPIYVVGDIHGRLDLFERVLSRINEHFEENKFDSCKLVCVGDYIDRGEHSAQVLERLFGLSLEFPDQVVCLVGNHEQMLIDFLREPESRGRRWFRNGGLQTLASFSVGGVSETSQEADLKRARDDLRAAMPAGLEDWLCALPMMFQSGNIVVAHAGADPTRALDDQEEKALLWGSSKFRRAVREDGNWVVYGHWIVDEPVVGEGRIGIDTGAYATNRLTSVALRPTGEVGFLTSDA